MDNIKEIAQKALTNADSLLPRFLPGGAAIGGEFIAVNPTRADRKAGSFKVNLSTGKWADFATNDRGGDLVSLVAYLDGISQLEAAKKVATEMGQEMHHRSNGPRHFQRGTPSKVWAYHDQAGNVIGKVCRFDEAEGSKVVLPYFLIDGRWRWKAPPAPRALYNLHTLAASEMSTVVLTEGEKAADAASRLFPDAVAMTWQGGCKAWNKTDWTPLTGRTVILWPDADEPGIEAMQSIREKLWSIGCRVHLPTLPKELPAGFDAADVSGIDQAMQVLNQADTKEDPPGRDYYLPHEEPMKADIERLFKLVPGRHLKKTLPPNQAFLVPGGRQDDELLKWDSGKQAFLFVG